MYHFNILLAPLAQKGFSNQQLFNNSFGLYKLINCSANKLLAGRLNAPNLFVRPQRAQRADLVPTFIIFRAPKHAGINKLDNSQIAINVER